MSKAQTMLAMSRTVAVLIAGALGACVQNQPPPVTAGPMEPNSSTVFTLALTPESLSGCIMGDPGMDRPMTVTISSGQATLFTDGGIHYSLDRTGPGRFHGGYYIDITVDLASKPKRLTIVNDAQTCTWAGTAG